MTSGLHGITLSNAAPFKARLTFTRRNDDTDTNGEPIDYTNASYSVVFRKQKSADAPLLTLSIGDGLTVITNEAEKQVFDMSLTVANINTLLAGKTTHVITYVFSIQPVGGSVATKPKGMGYDGIINICVASYG